MRKGLVSVIMAVMMIAMMASPSFAGTKNFHRGFHEGLGNIAAEVAVGAGTELVGGILNAVFGRQVISVREQPTYSPSCSNHRMQDYGYSGYGHLSPREEAYNKEMYRLQREAEHKWVQSERVSGKQQARNDFYGR
jgi:hypothetical protein